MLSSCFTYLFTYIDKLYSPQFIRRFTNVPTCLSYSYSFNEFIIYRRQFLGIGHGVLLVNTVYASQMSKVYVLTVVQWVVYSILTNCRMLICQYFFKYSVSAHTKHIINCRCEGLRNSSPRNIIPIRSGLILLAKNRKVQSKENT